LKFHLTVRWGHPGTLYHQAVVEAPGLREALERSAALLPDDVAASADLAELRPAPEPDERAYLDG
jgi:hypothetical protein